MAKLICSFCSTIIEKDYPTEMDSHGMCKKCYWEYLMKHDEKFAKWYTQLEEIIDEFELTDLTDYPLWNAIVTLKRWHAFGVLPEDAAYRIAHDGI